MRSARLTGFFRHDPTSAAASAVALLLMAAGPLHGQTTERPDPSTYWFATAGVSRWTPDFGESDGSYFGVRLGGGITIDHMELGLEAAVWPSVNGGVVYGLEAQSAVPFYVGTGTALDLVLGFGWSRDEYVGDRQPGWRYVEDSGTLAALGLRFRAHTRSGWGGRTGVFFRGDLGGLSAELRAALSWTQNGYTLAPGPRPALAFGGRVLHYGAVTGPWRGAGPAYGLWARRPITERLGAVLAASFLFVDGPYHTGAFVLQPTAEFRAAGPRLLAVRVGPGIVVMPEGNDMGATLGPSLEVETGWDVGGLGIRLGSGAIWTWRWHDPDYGDQLWWTLFVGIQPW